MAASIPNDTTSYLETRPVVKWETAEEVYRRQITTIWINTIDQIISTFFFAQNGSTSQQFEKRKQHIKIWSK